MKEPQADTVCRPQPEGKHPTPHLPTSQELELTSAQGAADGSSGGLKQATSAHNNAQTQQSSAAEFLQVRQAPAEMGEEQQQSAPNPHSTQTQQSSVVESPQMRQASVDTSWEQQSAPSQNTQTQQPSVENSQRGDGAPTHASQTMTGRAGATNRNRRSQAPAHPASNARQANTAWSGANQTPIAASGRSRAQQPPPRPYSDQQAHDNLGRNILYMVSRGLTQQQSENLTFVLNQNWYRPVDVANLSGVNSTPLGERRGSQRPAYRAPPPEGPVAPPRVLPNGQVAMSREEVMFAAAGHIMSPTMFENWMLFMSQDLSRDYITPAEWEQQTPPQQQSEGQNAAPQARADNARPAKRRRPSRSPDYGPATKRRRDDRALD